MKLDRNWKYKHESIKAPFVCPYCGLNDTEADCYGDGYFVYYCPHCNSEWTETKETWDSIQASGYIEK